VGKPRRGDRITIAIDDLAFVADPHRGAAEAVSNSESHAKICGCANVNHGAKDGCGRTGVAVGSGAGRLQ